VTSEQARLAKFEKLLQLFNAWITDPSHINEMPVRKLAIELTNSKISHGKNAEA
jgi:hypothetical protein